MKKTMSVTAILIVLMLMTFTSCASNTQKSPSVTTPTTQGTPIGNTTVPSDTAPATITAEEAEALAIAHAGVNADQVTRLRTERDYDDGRLRYDVEFYVNNTEYDVEVDAETGAIRSFDIDGQSAIAPAAITAEEAQNIALDHANLTADQVTGLRADYEIDDGVAQYDVQFRIDRKDYDYTIRADTGEILSFDTDD